MDDLNNRDQAADRHNEEGLELVQLAGGGRQSHESVFTD